MCQHDQKARVNQGFTLIELLIVIAIISILASILFPVFAQVREKARQTSSQSNLKQLAIAFTLYEQDYDDTLPPAGWFNPGAAETTQPDNFGVYRWPWIVLPYLKSMAVYRSPSDPNSSFDDPDCSDGVTDDCRSPLNAYYGYLWGLFPSYGYNWRYLAPSVQDQNGNNIGDPMSDAADALHSVGVSLAKIQTVSNTVMLSDSTWAPTADPGELVMGYFLIDPPQKWTGTPPLTATSFGYVIPRDQGHANVAFADGHVKAETIGYLDNEGSWTGNGQ